MAASSANEESVRSPPEFKIKNIQEKINFDYSVFSPFTKDVRPVGSLLFNIINKSSTLTDSDNESINEDAPTRSVKIHEEEDMFSCSFPSIQIFPSSGWYCIYCNHEMMRNIVRTGIVNDFTYSGESVYWTTLSPMEGMFSSNWRTKMKSGEGKEAFLARNKFLSKWRSKMMSSEGKEAFLTRNKFLSKWRSKMMSGEGKEAIAKNMFDCNWRMNMKSGEGKEAIAKNMFGSNWRTKMKSGEVDYAICVQLPKDLLKNCSSGGRKLFKHHGKLDLNNYTWTIVKVP